MQTCYRTWLNLKWWIFFGMGNSFTTFCRCAVRTIFIEISCNRFSNVKKNTVWTIRVKCSKILFNGIFYGNQQSAINFREWARENGRKFAYVFEESICSLKPNDAQICHALCALVHNFVYKTKLNGLYERVCAKSACIAWSLWLRGNGICSM